MEKYSISQAARKGVAAIVKEAEKDGFVLLERSENPIAIVVPLSISGYSKFAEFLVNLDLNELLEYGKDDKLQDFIYVMRKLTGIVKSKRRIKELSELDEGTQAELKRRQEYLSVRLGEFTEELFKELNIEEGTKLIYKYEH
jgi:hypothetical protein